ncbi:MAG: methyltransferase domain-containing protein [Desulfopila sp.]
MRDRFRRSIESYDDAALVQKATGDELIAQMTLYPEIRYRRVLEVGCCTGSMTRTLCSTHPVVWLWVNDLVPECCQRTVARVGSLLDTVVPLAGDIEAVDLPEDLDLIVSSSTLQWLRDLPTTLTKFAEALGEKGFLAFTLFGPGTMRQIAELIGVELEYVPVERLAEMLGARFRIRTMRTKTSTLYFDSPLAVLRHIQVTGVGGVGGYRWTPNRLRTFAGDYLRRFGTTRGVPLDYVAITVIADKR